MGAVVTRAVLDRAGESAQMLVTRSLRTAGARDIASGAIPEGDGLEVEFVCVGRDRAARALRRAAGVVGARVVRVRSWRMDGSSMGPRLEVLE